MAITKDIAVQEVKKERDSNFELFRILLMIMIVAHHYVVNSGLATLFDFKHVTGNMVFLQLLGFGGKTGINCFVLVTGFFMCKSNLTIKKFLKLFLEIEFYQLVIYAVFLLTGYADFSVKSFITTVFYVVFKAGVGFSGTIVYLYIVIPFLNILIKNMSKKQHLGLLAALVFYFTCISTFSYSNDTWSYLGWLVTIYLVGAYIRIYPAKLFDRKKLFVFLSGVSVACMWGSILAIDFVGNKFGLKWDYFMNDAHKLLALICSISFFMAFKNMQVKKNTFINTVATATFGVLLIHANSDTMRQWLWGTILNNTGYYNSGLLVIHAIASVLGVYIVCVILDLLRIKFIEKPFFDSGLYRNMEEKILKKFA